MASEVLILVRARVDQPAAHLRGIALEDDEGFVGAFTRQVVERPLHGDALHVEAAFIPGQLGDLVAVTVVVASLDGVFSRCACSAPSVFGRAQIIDDGDESTRMWIRIAQNDQTSRCDAKL